MIELKAGYVIPKRPFAGATVKEVSKNGWCVCEWPSGIQFKARAHWLIRDTQYKLIPSK